MPYFVDGHQVPEEIIRQAEEWLARDPNWNNMADPEHRALQLRAAAAQAAIERMIVERAAAADPRPIESTQIDQEARPNPPRAFPNTTSS